MNKKINESTVQDARENTLNKKNEVNLMMYLEN